MSWTHEYSYGRLPLQQRIAQRHNIPSIKEDMIRLVATVAMKGVFVQVAISTYVGWNIII
jgi:hypothetical protein